MKPIKLAVLTFIVFSCFAFVPRGFAQTSGGSTQSCDKLGPRTWKGGSIEEIQTQEAAYWGCRMNVPSETIKQWEQTSGNPDRIDRIKLGSVLGQKLVFIQRMGGTMRCFSFDVIKKTSNGWERVWEDAGEGYCMMKCPGIEMRIFGSRLVLEVPKSTDADCRDMFDRKEFVWDGKTFRAATDHALGVKP